MAIFSTQDTPQHPTGGAAANPQSGSRSTFVRRRYGCIKEEEEEFKLWGKERVDRNDEDQSEPSRTIIQVIQALGKGKV